MCHRPSSKVDVVVDGTVCVVVEVTDTKLVAVVEGLSDGVADAIEPLVVIDETRGFVIVELVDITVLE